MDLNYKKLFTVDLLHEYFAKGKCNDLSIVPSSDTAELFRSLNVLYRNIDNKFYALMRANDAGEPFNNTTENKYRTSNKTKVFRLYLKINEAFFYNYTNIGKPAAKKVFYFSNVSGNKKGSALYLSKEISDLGNGKNYVPGNLVMEPGTDNVHEAVTKNTNGGVAELTDKTLWAAKGTLQYPTEGDHVEYTTGSYPFTLSAPATKAEIKFFGYNFDAADPKYNVQVGEMVTQNYSNAQSEIMVDFSKLNPGYYSLKVNAESERMVYYDPRIQFENVFGIIEIYNHLPGTDDYALQATNEKINEKTYTLQFANRRVLWKYTRKNGKAKAVKDASAANYTFTLLGESFVSTVPIPLSEKGLTTLTLEFNTSDVALSPLPNPSPNRFGKFTQAGYEYLCSEINLNY